MNLLLDTIRRHKAGEAVGVTSICSAHPLVLEAAVLQALDNGARHSPGCSATLGLLTSR